MYNDNQIFRFQIKTRIEFYFQIRKEMDLFRLEKT